MDQETSDKIGRGVQIFGAILFVFCLGAFVYSVIHPVTSGPMPEKPWEQEPR